MALRPLHMGLDPRDLNLERFDPRVELLDRHGIKVLLGKLNERVARLAREKLIQIHAQNR